MTTSKSDNGAAVGLHAIVRLFMVCWDDQQGLCVPMVWDKECDGAICGGIGEKDRVALFTSRKAARKAIDISTRFALLRKAQGGIVNEDFLGECRKNLRVVECQPNVPSDLSLLASGIRACSAGEMPEVPQAQGLGRLARWNFSDGQKELSSSI